MQDFQTFFVAHEAMIRLACFIVLLMFFLLLEIKWPRRVLESGLRNRQLNNLSLLIMNSLAARIFVPLATFELALFTARNDMGLFNLLALPFVVNIVFTIIVFDLLIYIQHVVFHQVRALWRIHRVHHTDIHFDVTTGVRFHPIEIVLSLFYKLLAVFLLGPAALGIILYEVLLNSAALFTHSNITLNKNVDRVLRIVFVTPDMHRVHHSTIRTETDSNYGNLFSCWDRLFKTYKSKPAAGYDNMEIGLDDFRDRSSGQLLQLLKITFFIFFC